MEGVSYGISPMTKKGTKCYLYFNRVLSEAILEDNTLQTAIPDFSKIAQSDCTGIEICEETNGLYQTTDADGTTYYFRGEIDNNWVSFGGFYWRIIRINGDGSIRMIYSGVDNGSVTESNRTGSGTAIGRSRFNEESNDNAYIGYMYGTPGSDTYEETHANINDSTIKTILDEWYQNNLLSYSDYISIEAGFCGDRSIYSGTGIGTGVTLYNANNRLIRGKNPSFYCNNNSNDLYTLSSSSKGNKALTYPIALITADELSYAGSIWSIDNKNNYLNSGIIYWSMTPDDMISSTRSMMFILNSQHLSSAEAKSSTFRIRPVINLKNNITISKGNGSSSNPYIIETD